jgi:hypothetical protein
MKHSMAKHKQLFKLLNDTGLTNQRQCIVAAFTGGRSESSSELDEKEIREVISYLENYNTGTLSKLEDFIKGDRMRKRVLSLCHQYGWTKYDPVKHGNSVDFVALNAWMLKYSYLHKLLNKYTYNELPQLITQLEQVVNNYLNAI